MRLTKGIPQSNRDAVTERSGGVCEGCGTERAANIHHRKYLSRGGTHDVHNLLHLCGVGNTSGCHGRAHTADGEGLGWSVPSWGRSETWPVRVASVDGWVWLADRVDSRGRWWSEPFGDATADMLMRGGEE